jgi:hypothetical protein
MVAPALINWADERIISNYLIADPAFAIPT